MSLIKVNDLTFSYEGSYENIFEDVSFQIDIDWKLGFSGRNGRGKTTFLKLLLGKYIQQDQGTRLFHPYLYRSIAMRDGG